MNNTTYAESCRILTAKNVTPGLYGSSILPSYLIDRVNGVISVYRRDVYPSVSKPDCLKDEEWLPDPGVEIKWYQNNRNFSQQIRGW